MSLCQLEGRMSKVSPSGQENADLCTQGVTEGLADKPLEGKASLEILDIFWEDGLRAYIVGHVEGSDDAVVQD
jgi:hypothetical protein